MAAVVEMDKVFFSFGGTQVFSNLNLEIREGELCAILGKIASGKSTLIRLIGGVLPPAKGEIRVKGHTWAEWRKKGPEEIYRYLTVTFQKGGLFDSLTVEENLALPLKELGH